MSESNDGNEDIASNLIAALADEGMHVDDGGFTLDKAAALAKLRGYQLADPHAYLLLLVEAAYLAGRGTKQGSTISIQCRSDTIVRFRGPALVAEQLRDLFSAVFGATRGLDGEALRRAEVMQLLGLAANNALALTPEAIFIEGCDPSGAGLRLHVKPDAQLELERVGELEPGWIEFRFDGHGTGYTRGVAERDLVTARCRHADFPVLVDGAMVSQKRIQGLYRRAKLVVGDRSIGVAAYRRTPEPPTIEIVNRGVSVELPEADLQPGFVALAFADLPMDLSRKQLLEGPELAAIRRAIGEARGQLQAPRYDPGRVTTPNSAAPGLAVVGAFVAFVLFMAFSLSNSSAPTNTAATQPAQPDLAALERDCKASHAPSCEAWVQAGRERLDQTGEHDLLLRAATLACQYKPGFACVDAAWYFDHGFVPAEQRDLPATSADELLERGCAADLPNACMKKNRGSLLVRCDTGDALACYVAGLRDDAGALLERACFQDIPEACHATGVAYLRERGLAFDAQAALAAFDSACTRGYEPGCEAQRWLTELNPSGPGELGPDAPSDPPSTVPPRGTAPWITKMLIRQE